jgi:hypothetical protein
MKGEQPMISFVILRVLSGNCFSCLESAMIPMYSGDLPMTAVL